MAELLITPELTVHGVALVPFSNPGLPSNCWVAPPELLTLSAMAVEWDMPPPLPVIVTVYVPAAVAPPTSIVIFDEPEPGAAIAAGEKPAVAPAGNPEADSAIEEL